MRMLIAFLALAALGLAGPVSGHAAPDHGAEAKSGDPVHDAEKPSIMKPQWDTAVWTCVVFVLLFLILSKYAWGPILEGLKAREQTIANVMEEAKRLREDNARDSAKFKAEMDAAFAKIPAMMDEARRDAAALKESIRTEGNAEVQKERQRLLRELDIAKDQALQDIWNQAANVATLIASKAIGRSLTADDHRRLVDDAIDELKQKAKN